MSRNIHACCMPCSHNTSCTDCVEPWRAGASPVHARGPPITPVAVEGVAVLLDRWQLPSGRQVKKAHAAMERQRCWQAVGDGSTVMPCPATLSKGR
jgi:hypothetical protein